MKYVLIIFVITAMSSSAWAQKKQLGDDQICRATIAAIFNKKVETVSIERLQRFSGQHIAYISFEPEDGDRTTRFKCYVDGKKIAWATETGAYRNTDIDSVIDYEVKGNVLTVRESHKNGSVYRQAFDIKKLIAKK